MNETPFFSIVVPVFNTVRYLPACIDAILGQSYTNFELILVDDGSTDGSANLCDAYSAKDRRVHCIHQPNGGVSSARNTGLDFARGSYVWFCDSDDTVLPEALQIVYRCLSRSHAPLVAFSLDQVDEDGRKVGIVPAPKPSRVETDGPLQCGDPLYPQAHIFRRDLAEGERFDTTLALLEDRDFFYRISWKATGSTEVIEEPLYRYLVTREDSAVNSLSVAKLAGASRVQYEILLNELAMGRPMPAFKDFVCQSLSALSYIACSDVSGDEFQTIRTRLAEQKRFLGQLGSYLKAKYILAIYFPHLFKLIARMRRSR